MNKGEFVKGWKEREGERRREKGREGERKRERYREVRMN